uniref:M23 family metallopeptidase n=1 Tax=uncultured Christiangramia sp. TaxID=503836 RepID=UPI0025F00C02
FSFIGFNRLFNQDELIAKLNQLKRFEKYAIEIIQDLEGENLIKNFPDIEVDLKEHFSSLEDLVPISPPVTGYVTQGLDIKSHDNKHYGIDIAAKFQDDIYSPGDGKVIFSGKNDDLGNTIILNHPGGFITVFAHTDSNIVVAGMSVKKGQIIANVGETGNSKGPHLHFEMWKNAEILDPRDFIEIYKKKDISTNETRQPN